jgi:protein TonB
MSDASSPAERPQQEASSSREASSSDKRNSLEMREQRRDKRGKNTLILRELALIAALGLVILAFNLDWGSPQGDQNVTTSDRSEIRLRDVRVTPPEPPEPEPEPEPEQRRPEPKTPQNVERKEVPDQKLEENPETTDEPTVEPMQKMKTSPTADQSTEAPKTTSKPAPDPTPEPPKNKVFSKNTADRNAQMQGSLQPTYPSEAKQAGIQGQVVLQFVVDESGRAQDIQVLSSPNDMLAEAAVNALEEKSFKPAMQNGEPVKMRMSQPVTFRLE